MIRIMSKYLYLFIGLSLTSTGLAMHGVIRQYPDSPWVTGPLLAPSSHVTPFGRVNLEPYYFLHVNNGHYDSNWKKIHDDRFVRNLFQLYCYGWGGAGDGFHYRSRNELQLLDG